MESLTFVGQNKLCNITQIKSTGSIRLIYLYISKTQRYETAKTKVKSLNHNFRSNFIANFCECFCWSALKAALGWPNDPLME